MVKTLNRVLFVLTLSLCIGFAQEVTLTFHYNGDVTYSSDQDISGYQFNTHYDCVNSGYAIAQKTFRNLLTKSSNNK